MQTTAIVVGDLLAEYVPPELQQVADPDTAIPELARNVRAMAAVDEAIRRVPSTHDLYLSDARTPPRLVPESVHLVVTSPPYWTLKRYRETTGSSVTSRTTSSFWTAWTSCGSGSTTPWLQGED